MLLLAGWGNNLRKVCEGGLMYCPNCNNVSNSEIVCLNKKISLFLVPIAKWDIKYYQKCLICDAGYELTEVEKNVLVKSSICLPNEHVLNNLKNDIESRLRLIEKNNIKNMHNELIRELKNHYDEQYLNKYVNLYCDHYNWKVPLLCTHP